MDLQKCSRIRRSYLVLIRSQYEKDYLAGALHYGTGRVFYADDSNNSSVLFIKIFKNLKAIFHKTKHIALILDNYIIYKRHVT